jgi:hypothetical protein
MSFEGRITTKGLGAKALIRATNTPLGDCLGRGNILVIFSKKDFKKFFKRYLKFICIIL